jgi:hypothetical protein
VFFAIERYGLKIDLQLGFGGEGIYLPPIVFMPFV